MRHSFRAHKYGVSAASARTVDGIVFDSKAEAARYGTLKLLRSQGEVVQFLRQTPFHLPGGVLYRCDFLVFWSDGRVTIEDAKGMKTESYKAKKRMVEALYAPLTITEV